ncbi:MAG: alpha/beta fold hydrolase [Pseudomonadota bacterium]
MLHTEHHPGQESGPHLLLLHGSLCNQAQWVLNLEALGQVCRPLTAELLGHGESAAPTDPAAYTASAYVDYIEQIREHHGIERWYLCGYSLSAGLVMHYALRHPERVEGLIITNSMSAFAPEKLRAAWLRSGPDVIRAIETRGRAYIDKLPMHPRFATSLPAAVYEPLLARCALHDPQGIGLTIAHTVPDACVRPRLAELDSRILLLQGVHEKRFAEHATFAATRLRRLTQVRVDAGHAVNMQQADAFNDHVRQFLRDA